MAHDTTRKSREREPTRAARGGRDAQRDPARERARPVDEWAWSVAADPTTVQAFGDAVGEVHRSAARANDHIGVQLRAEPGGAAPGPGRVQVEAERGVSGAGGALPFRDRIQQAFGRHDVGSIRAHQDAVASSAGKAIGARAYARGESVAFARAPDLHTAAHEAAHVIQQRAGVSLSGGVGRAGDAYERHADRIADAVVRGESAEGLLGPVTSGRAAVASGGAIQRVAEGGAEQGRDGAAGAAGAAAGGDSVWAKMAGDVEMIVEKLQANLLSAGDQWSIVLAFEKYLRADHAVQDVNPGRTDRLDRFIELLKQRRFVRDNLGTLMRRQDGFVFNELWGRLQGPQLERFRAAVAQSARHAATGPEVEPNEDPLRTVVAPVVTRAVSLLSLGVIDERLFSDMAAAAAQDARPGSWGFMRQAGVVLQRGFDVLTLGVPRAFHESARAFALQHPRCSLGDILQAGLLGGANAVLPIHETKILGQAMGLVPPGEGEVRPDTARAVQAGFEAMLKLIVIGTIVHAKLGGGRDVVAQERVRQELGGGQRPARGAPTSERTSGAAERGAPPASGGAATPRFTRAGRGRGGGGGREAGRGRQGGGSDHGSSQRPRSAPEAGPASALEVTPKLAELRSLPRAELIRRVRRASGEAELQFWEGVKLGDTFEGVRAGPEAAAALGVPRGTIIGYKVTGAQPKGGAISDMANVETTAAPYPDPFRARR